MEGKCGIRATVIADSISCEGDLVRLTTFELEYPRFIHAELMTHRMFSRNAASSRAIPVERQIELILQRTAMPVFWGKNKAGMSAVEECEKKFLGIFTREQMWFGARNVAVWFARRLHNMGFHKQIVNRILEPFAFIKVVVTATEFDNFWYLRCHKDAQPEIQELARVAREAYEKSIPFQLSEGEWHVPYFEDGVWRKEDGPFTPLDHAIAISASCAAQVSYRRNDDTIEKALDIYERLVLSKPVHASPFEHQGTPISDKMAAVWVEGITHKDAFGTPWSGNFRCWIQNRQLIEGNVCKSYEETLK